MVKVGTAYQNDNFSGDAQEILSEQIGTDFTAAKLSALLIFGKTSTVTFFSQQDGGGDVVGVLTPASPTVVMSAPALSYSSTATA